MAHLTGDKAYSSRANRAALCARRVPHTIPEREDQKANRARGGRPPAFDRARYRQRDQVERLMNRRERFRAVATRYDKLAERYEATITVADIFIWLRAGPDQPRGDPGNTPRHRHSSGLIQRRRRITATATGASGTSEFSDPVPAEAVS